MNHKISVREALQLENTVFIDTRTPAEFAETHIPNAVNIPIFSNEERALIGTLYTQLNKQTAIDKGIELFSQKMPNILQQIKQYLDKTIVVNCWRGGMRSAVVTSLLVSLGYKALQLEGGHKAFRNYVLKELQQFQLKPKLIVVYGLTGTGKTELLQRFSNALDLEELAQHRNSRLGMVGLTPRNQKMFDAMILLRLSALQNQEFIIIEGESRKLGKVLLPEFLYKAMKQGINIKVTLHMDLRAKRIVKEYFDTEQKIAQVKAIVQTMTQVLSKKVVAEIVTAIEKKDYVTATKLLFVHFYDKKYNHTVESIKYDLVVDTADLDGAIQEIKNLIIRNFSCS